jgi:hypothetical protein
VWLFVRASAGDAHLWKFVELGEQGRLDPLQILFRRELPVDFRELPVKLAP